MEPQRKSFLIIHMTDSIIQTEYRDFPIRYFKYTPKSVLAFGLALFTEYYNQHKIISVQRFSRGSRQFQKLKVTKRE